MAKKLTSAFLFLAFGIVTHAAGWSVKFEGGKEFIENKGQFDVRHPQLAGMDIRYAIDETHKQIYFTPSGIVYHFFSSEKNKNRQKGDRTKPRFVTQHEIVEMKWEGANAKPEIVASVPSGAHHAYAINTNDKFDVRSIENLKGYKKITYKNLYPGIDAEFEIHPLDGFKYSFIVQPGADPSMIKMTYDKSRNIQLGKDGALALNTKFGDIIEHRPVSFQGRQEKKVASEFRLHANTVSFAIGKYDNTKTLVIDPWVQTPNFNTQWKCVWECETDPAGNAYLIGGVMPMVLQKYNSAGVLQWSYNTPYDTSNSWLGTFAVDSFGSSYVTAGSAARIQKVNTSGGLVWNNANPPGGLLKEFWSISFNSNQTRLVIGGTDGSFTPLPWVFEINVNNGQVVNNFQVTGGQLLPTQEVRAITAAGNGRYFYLTHDTIGYFNQNTSACGNANVVKIPSGKTLGYKCENYRTDNSGVCAIKAFGTNVFVNWGNEIQKREVSTGLVVASAPIPGGGFTSQFGGSQVENSGIDIDDCGNIFVGSKGQVVKFDVNLTQLATYPVSFNVYDVHIGNGGEIVVGGSTGTASSGARTGYLQSISAGACGVLPLINCDPTICRINPFCTTDNPATLQAATAGGAWSGPGVNAQTGVFNPATAGVGVHTIVYTLPCGSDSQKVTVNLCTPLSVCRETNGNLTVSGGTPVYRWSYRQQGGSTPITTQAECTACGGSWVPFVNLCTVGGFPTTTCNTATSWVEFATGVSVTPPQGRDTIRVVDNAGTELIINGLANVQPCTQCPAITVTVQSKQDVTCLNPTSGSATFTATGGSGNYTYTWSPATGSTTATASNLAAGTYNVTATDANNCTGTGTVTIVAPANPTIAISNQANPQCNQTDGSITVSIAGGSAPYTVTLNSAQGQPQTQNLSVPGSATFSNLGAGAYTVTVRDVNGCEATQSAILAAPANCCELKISAASTGVSCSGNDGSVTVSITTAGTSPYEYSIDGSNYQASNVFAGLTAGTYSVYTRDATFCADTVTVEVEILANSIELTLAVDEIKCLGDDNAQITANVSGAQGNVTYQWSVQGSGNSINNLPAGTYSVTVTDANNCSKTASVVIENPERFEITLGNNVVFCEGKTEVINAPVGLASYLWSNGDTTASISVKEPGLYSVSVTNAAGCTATATVEAEALTAPKIEMPNDTTVFEGSPVLLEPTVIDGTPGKETFSWTPEAGLSCSSCANPIATPEQETTYTLSYTSDNLCEATGKFTIKLVYDVVMPNAFSPNGDGKNDVLLPIGSGVKTIVWKVYNRWGQQVFSSNSMTSGWNGSHRNFPQPAGVYYFSMQVEFKNSTTKNLSGTVTLIR